MNQKYDLNSFFGQMLGQWEELANEAAKGVMQTDQYGKAQSNALAFSLKMRETINDQMNKYLELANMPSKDEIETLQESIGQLDGRMARMEIMLEELIQNQTDAGQTVPSPPRTRKPNTKRNKGAKDG